MDDEVPPIPHDPDCQMHRCSCGRIFDADPRRGTERPLKGGEGRFRRAYYDYRATLLDTAVDFRQHPPAASGMPLGADETVDEHGARWSLQGLRIGPELDDADLAALFEVWQETGGDAVTFQVTDNGASGDGLWLEVHPGARGGTPKTRPERFGDNERVETPKPLLGVRVEPGQAVVLGEALIAAARLRLAQEVP